MLWKKTAEQGDTTTIASHAKNGHHNVKEPFGTRVGLSRTLDDSRLTIQSVRTEDEACYTCVFNTYPDGSRSATACLSVLGESGVLGSFHMSFLSLFICSVQTARCNHHVNHPFD